jgi:putative aminopeptidase FrvX
MGLIEELCNTYGPAGREHRVRGILERELKKFRFELRTDRLGNLIVHRPGKSGRAQKIMLCAHMDEIGLIVTYIDKNGFLRFTNVGGVFSERVLYQRVVFENGTTGIIGVEPPKHESKEDSKSEAKPKFEKMFIDIGVHDRASAEKKVRIGDIAAFSQQVSYIDKKRIAAKALDDRIGCYCLVETAKRLKQTDHDIYFVFSVQEEVGLRGARTGAYAIDPTYAIAVDVTDTGDTPEAQKMEVSVGKGVAIKVKDSWFIANPTVKDKLAEYARELSIPYQFEVLEHGSTDAAVIQLVKGGVLSGVLSIPTRYIHSTSEVCDLSDVDGAIKLLVHICTEGLD